MSKFTLVLAVLASGLVAGQQTPSQESHRIICTLPRGEITKMVKPSYPPEAVEKRMSGRVILEVDVDERGEPTDIRVKEGPPILAEAARLAVSQWRWKPLLLNGKAVRVATPVQVNFELPSKKKTNKTT